MNPCPISCFLRSTRMPYRHACCHAWHARHANHWGNTNLLLQTAFDSWLVVPSLQVFIFLIELVDLTQEVAEASCAERGRGVERNTCLWVNHRRWGSFGLTLQVRRGVLSPVVHVIDKTPEAAFTLYIRSRFFFAPKLDLIFVLKVLLLNLHDLRIS